MDYNSLNLLFKNNILYTKKFNFKKKLEKYAERFSRHIKDIEDIKLTGCNISHASNWVLDNFFSIDNAFNTCRKIKPKRYKTLKFRNEFLPRTYLFCSCFVEQQKSIFDGNEFLIKVNQYGENIKLGLDEILDIPFFINYITLEKILNSTSELLIIEKRNLEVYYLFSKVLKLDKLRKGKKIFKIVSNYFENNFSTHAFEYFINLLKEHRVDESLLNDFIDRVFKNENLTGEKLKNINSKKINELRINISMNIHSLKNIASFDWKNGLERVSPTHKEFLKDPSGIYPKMDYHSREFYRKTFYEICVKNNLDESFECSRIIEMCKEGGSEVSRHIGYYILDDGVKKLTRQKKRSFLKKVFYFSSMAILSFSIPVVLFMYGGIQVHNLYLSIFLFFVFLILSSNIFVDFVNYIFSKNVKSKFIPKMDYSQSIPDEAKSMVVVPHVLNSKKDIDEMFENLEISYICNVKNNLYFSILIDYADTISYEGSDDKILLDYAREYLNKLNKKYENHSSEIKFYIFVRDKIYNESNKIYMGWERKGGKILEFIKFLKGEDTSFRDSIENYKDLKNIKYIITMDSHSKLMKGTVYELVGTIHHVLNRAVVKKFKNRNKVVRGYGIIQPRIKVSFKSSISTVYSKIFAGSNFASHFDFSLLKAYQEVFGDSLFIGKGIIDVDVFNKVLRNAVPENKILNWDLVEGFLLRVLFSKDIEIEEKYPPNLLLSFSQFQRDVKSNWQLVYYLFKSRGISYISKYKILDNLRRSLIPICYIIAFLVPSLTYVGQKNIYYGLIFLSLMYPIFLNVSSVNLIKIPREDISFGVKNLKDKLLEVYLRFSLLPYQSYLCLNVISKVLFRMIFTKKNLLELRPHKDVEGEGVRKIYIHMVRMFPCLAFGFLYLGFGIYSRVYVSVFISFTFFMAPLIAYFISKNLKINSVSMKPLDNIFLRSISRSIFAYFEDFVNESTNYLVCDSYSESPNVGISKNTSPTNIGMSLNVFSIGRDFGFISVTNSVNILNKIMNSIDILPTYRGHLYSNYDIEKCIPFGERFISTAHSGNLLLSYYLCKKSLEDMLNTPLIHKDIVKSFEEMAYLSVGFEMDHSYKDIIDYGYTCSSYIEYIKFLERISEFSRQNISDLGKENTDIYWHIKINESANDFLNEILNITCKIHEMRNFKLDKFGEIFVSTNICDLESAILKLIENYNNSSVRDENVYLKMCKVLDNVGDLVRDIEFLIVNINSKINNMDFKFLYDENKNLLSIGYDCENDILESDHHNVLASESRISSFLSIAKGDVPIRHWFNLSRAGVKMKGNRTLLSLNGSMFEYFMPSIYMRAYPNTLLHETYKGFLDSQIKFSKVNKIPFGFSESCFYELHDGLNYNYRVFGSPYTSINRDYTNLVVSPYSSIMSCGIDFEASIENLKSLSKLGCLGKYGFYESVDFTKSRMKNGEEYFIIKNYMACHQAVSLMALSNVLINNICQNRFEGIVEVQSISEILHESVENIKLSSSGHKTFEIIPPVLNEEFKPRVIKYTNDKICDVQIYSNGNYSLGISSSGGGFLKFKNETISEMSSDFTNEKPYGCIYINDHELRRVFSSTYLPCKNDEVNYTCEFGVDKGKFVADSNDIRVISEVFVSSDDNVEVRKVLFKNLTLKHKRFDVYSYFESETINRNFEYIHEDLIGVCSNEEGNLFMAHSVFFEDSGVKDIEFENHKERFIGINGNLQNPIFTKEKHFYKTERFNLENIMSMKMSISIAPYSHKTLYFINSIGETKKEAICSANKYKNLNLLLSLSENNFYNFKSLSNSLGLTSKEIGFFNYLTSKILYGELECEYKINSSITINDLISHSIDPLIPIVAIEVKANSDMGNLEIMLKLFLYFSNLGLNFNFVILNGYLGYDKKLDKEIESEILKYGLGDRINVNHGIYVILSNLYKNTHELIRNISNVFVKSSGVNVFEQMGFSLKGIEDYEKQTDSENWVIKTPRSINEVLGNINFNNYLLEMSSEIWGYADVDKYTIPKKDLKFYNSYGGFSKDLSYIIKLNEFNIIPHTYRNVLSNKYISTCVLSNGLMSTRAFDCGEFSITERIDSDKRSLVGECIYLREGDFVWSPTLNPVGNGEDYVVSNSCFSCKIENKINDIKSEVKCFVPEDKKYKIVKIKFKNLSDRNRSLNISYFAPILMTSKSDYSKKLKTGINEDFKYIYCENIFSRKFRNVKAYLKFFGCEDVSFTGSKKEFLGINKGYLNPSGVYRDSLSNLTGINIESCLSAQGKITLHGQSVKEVYVVFGYDYSIDKINSELREFSNDSNLFSKLYHQKRECEESSTAVQIKTKDFHLDVLMNKWLLHQNENEKFILSASKDGELNSVVGLMEECLIYNYINPLESKKNIIKVFSNIYEDGKFKDKWSNLTKGYTVNNSLFDGLWILFIFADYIKVTGDLEILNMEIKLMSENDSEIKFSTLYDKTMSIIKRGIEFDDFKFPRLCKNVFELKTIFILHKVLGEFLEIFKNFDSHGNQNIFHKVREDILNTIPKYFNGEFYLKNLNKESSRVIDLETQALYLICIEDGENRERVLSSIEKYLVNMELGFVRDSFENKFSNRDSKVCFQDSRALILFVKSLVCIKLNNVAYRYLNFLNPILKTIDRNYANTYRKEPYFIPCRIEFRGNDLVRVLNEDYNYVSALFYRIVLDEVLGFKLCKDGFYISPCVPNDWSNYTISYFKDSCHYKIIVRRGESKGIKINGEKYVENFIKFGNEGKFVIDVTI